MVAVARGEGTGVILPLFFVILPREMVPSPLPTASVEIYLLTAEKLLKNAPILSS
jgi:hypothetical protein